MRSLQSCTFFFFSRRRRHTRYIGDWSSDVCSSDLPAPRARAGARGHEALAERGARQLTQQERSEERRVGKEGRGRGGRERRAETRGKISMQRGTHECSARGEMMKGNECASGARARK